jgi:hypothetical protein
MNGVADKYSFEDHPILPLEIRVGLPKAQVLVHAANFRAANCRLLNLTTRPPAISHSVVFFEFLSAWIETATCGDRCVREKQNAEQRAG